MPLFTQPTNTQYVIGGTPLQKVCRPYATSMPPKIRSRFTKNRSRFTKIRRYFTKIRSLFSTQKEAPKFCPKPWDKKKSRLDDGIPGAHRRHTLQYQCAAHNKLIHNILHIKRHRRHTFSNIIIHRQMHAETNQATF